MAKNKKKKDRVSKNINENRGMSTSDFYELKTDAVERLVTADAATAPEVSDEEIARVSGKKRLRIPNTVKVMFIKFWFHGAICFFFFLGLGTYIADIYDMIFVLMIATGIITDLLTNKLLRFIEPSPGANDRFLMVRSRKYQSFVLNILYAIPLVYSIVSVYGGINLIIEKAGGEAGYLTVGPVLYGLFGLILDQLFVGARNLLSRIFADAKKAAGGR